MNDTPTPETDAFMTRIRGIDGDKYWVPVATARRLERERDQAREVAKEADLAHDMSIADLAKCEAAIEIITSKAKDLINRWDQPSWKDSEPTAGYIYALRNAVENYEITKIKRNYR
jgi:hypothetical protein